MKKICSFFIVLSFLFFAVGVYSDQKGSADMVLNGGKTGQVPFPHYRHQTTLNEDCQVCHSLFPQEKNSIDKLKKTGALEKKSVMNNCKSCHKERLSQSQKSGPVKCKECHSL